MPVDGGQCDALARFAGAGIDTREVARKLQADGAKSFIEAWQDLLVGIEAKSLALA